MLNMLSPDGFTLYPNEQYFTKKEVEQAFKKWSKRFEQQGYYSSNNGRIPLSELRSRCTIIIEEAYEQDEITETQDEIQERLDEDDAYNRER